MSASQEQVSSMTDEVIKKDVAYPISTVPDTGFTYLCCPLKVIIHNLRQDLTGLRAASVHSVPNQRSQSVFDNIFHGMQIDAPSTGQGRKREHVTSSTLVHDIHDMNGHDIKWK